MGNSADKLAIDGGSPVREAPLPARGHIGSEERDAVGAYMDKVLATGALGAYQGEEEEAYCAAFAEYLGGGYADAVSSGSAAIYVALLALELEAFSEVIIGPFTDPGGIMPIPLQSMIPMIADSAPGSFNTGPEQVEDLISPRTSAIIVPHIAGEPADIGGIMELAGRHGIPVIEDCAQAHGARFKGQLAGSFGDLSAFSTNSGKNHSSGGQGGMVFTRDEALYQSVRRMADRVVLQRRDDPLREPCARHGRDRGVRCRAVRWEGGRAQGSWLRGRGNPVDWWRWNFLAIRGRPLVGAMSYQRQPSAVGGARYLR